MLRPAKRALRLCLRWRGMRATRLSGLAAAVAHIKESALEGSRLQGRKGPLSQPEEECTGCPCRNHTTLHKRPLPYIIFSRSSFSRTYFPFRSIVGHGHRCDRRILQFVARTLFAIPNPSSRVLHRHLHGVRRTGNVCLKDTRKAFALKRNFSGSGNPATLELPEHFVPVYLAIHHTT